MKRPAVSPAGVLPAHVGPALRLLLALTLLMAGCVASPDSRQSAMVGVPTPMAATPPPGAGALSPTLSPSGGEAAATEVTTGSPPPAAPVTATEAGTGEPPGPSAAVTSTVTAPTPDASGGAGLPAFSHVFIIIMENQEASQVVGSADAPYLNSLATQYARAGNYYAVTHPSLPNYLAMIGGDTFGVTSDCTECYVNGDNLASQLSKAGRTWKAYMESMPQPCFTGPGTDWAYAKKHDPFIYFDNIRKDPGLCGQIVPLTQLDTDLKANNLPNLVWIGPNLCSDMHDCGVRRGDDWLHTWVSRIVASPAWRDNGVLFITFDEGTTNNGCCQYATGGKVDTLVIAPSVRPGFVSPVAYNHYSLLRTIEQAWALPPLGKAGCDCTPAMTDFFAPQ